MKAFAYAFFFLPITLVAQVPQERTVPLEEEIQQEIAESRIHLGRMQLLPVLAMNNAGYDSNIFGTPEPTVSDWTATVTGGFHYVLPFGGKMFLRGDLLPHYYWYAHHVDQRSLGGLYTLSWLGFFNRMSTEVNGGYSEAVTHLSSENEAFVKNTVVSGAAAVELKFSQKWSLLMGGEGYRRRFADVGAHVTHSGQLDRDEYAVHAGLRYRWTSFFDAVAEVQGTRANFIETSAQHDNQTRAYLLGVHYDRPRLFVNVFAGYRDARPYNGSTFLPFTSWTGGYFVSYYLAGPLELQFYGNRLPGYSQTAENAYFFEIRNGAAIVVHVGYRFLLRAFGVYGTNDYPVPVPVGSELVDRTDHFSTVGGGLTASVFRNASLTAQVKHDNISSNVPGVGRSIFRFTTSVGFNLTPTR